MTQHSKVPLRAARGIGATLRDATRLAARHTTAAASNWERLVHAAGCISSAVTLIAALQIWQRTSVEIRPFEPMHL